MASRCTPARRSSSSTAPSAGDRRRRHRGRIRPPAASHRLESVRAAGAGQGPARGDRLPRHRRHRGDDRRCRAAQARCGDRRRFARSRGCQRPEAARHGRVGGAHHAVADGAPARRGGRQAAARFARAARHQVPDRRADGRAARQRAGPGQRGEVQGRQRDPRRLGGDGRRHPPQHRAGRERRPVLQPRHRRQRHAADHHRPAHLRGRRMRRAPRRGLRSGGAAVRAGQGVRHAPGAVRHRALLGQPDQHQAQGHRHRSVLGRQLHGSARAPRRSCCPIRWAASTRSW